MLTEDVGDAYWNLGGSNNELRVNGSKVLRTTNHARYRI